MTYRIAQAQLDRIGDALDIWNAWKIEAEEADALRDAQAVVLEVKLQGDPGDECACRACTAEIVELPPGPDVIR